MLRKNIENALDVEQQESLNSSVSVVSGTALKRLRRSLMCY